MMPRYVKYNAMKENYNEIKLTTQQMKDNAETPKAEIQQGKMTVEEQLWAEKFEELLYAEQRGKIHDAVDAFEALTNRQPTKTEIENINANIQVAITSNPTRAEALVRGKRKAQNFQGIRAPKSNMYDSSDYVRVMPGKILKDDLGFTAVYSTAEAIESASGSNDHTESHLADKVYKPFKVEAGLNPDETAVMVNPEDGMIEAIDHAAKKNRSLEKLIEDAKLSKEAKENLLNITQKFTYEAMTYTFHGTQYMNLNYILKGVNGQLYVQDQHDRIQSIELYLKRCTEDSFATHAETYHPNGTKETWVYKKGPRANIEGKAVKYEAV